MEAIHTTEDTNSATTIANTNATTNTTTNESNIHNPIVIIEKKKRGRKKNIKPDAILLEDENVTDSITTTTSSIVEKKIRKRRSKKTMALVNAIAVAAAAAATAASSLSGTENNTNYANSVISGESNINATVTSVKVRKRRVCKSKNKTIIDPVSGEPIGQATGSNVIMDSDNMNTSVHSNPPEEKVAKKRGRKPKGGKIITQKLEENNNQNEIPNIILHLKCSINDIKNKNSDSLNTEEVDKNEIQSYNNSSQLIGSDIPPYLSKVKNTCGIESNSSIPICNDSSAHLFKVYTPNILSGDGLNKLTQPVASVSGISSISNATCSITGYSSNEILNHRTGIFNDVYSPDINSYNNDYDNRNNDDEYDGGSGTCKNEREIWRKISQLKVSFHKSDICKNIGGTQRSACFWCTCEFDSPAIYIPKTLTKDVYNVYGCFCSPECSAAFLMNENIDTSTKFERYHLLNLLYGKIYKYEKSIKIAPNPFYLLNKFYGNLTIQEYRKLFQSDQMIYIVNKPLTHILPELYEDNNDFLLNNKIIPTNSVNIKKNKPLKSNIINNAFGITVGGN